jgi:hypothetical protein
MRNLLVVSILALAAAAAAAAAPAAIADGGPSPGALGGADGVRSPASSIRYVALPERGRTTLAAIDTTDGRVLAYGSVRGAFGIPLVANDGSTGGLSADGRTLVLSSFGGPPGASATSTFALVATRTLRSRRLVALRGSFSFDALSPDGSRMYLIQYTSTRDSTRYRVRAFDVRESRLVPGAIVDKREPRERMQGYPLTRAATRDGGWAYTLYARDGARAFVHALDTRHARAFCIDLPWQLDRGIAEVSLAVRGRRLVLDRAGIGRVTVDRRTLRVRDLS